MNKLTKSLPSIRVDEDLHAAVMRRVAAELALYPQGLTCADILRAVLEAWARTPPNVSRETFCETRNASQCDAK